ncbi:MAG: alpha/beta hydrolase, partial [Gammaproteobacteria bacterium]
MKAALAKFSADARASGDPLVLYGMSLGGHLAVVVAAQNPDLVDALVIEGAFTSHRDMAAAQKGALARAFVSEPYSAEDSIGAWDKALLIIHSVDDEIVPFSMGQELFELAGEPKQLLEIDGPHLAAIAAHGERIGEAIVTLVGGKVAA